MNLKKIAAALVVTAALGFGAVTDAAAQSFVLPTPENNANATYGLYPDATGNLREAILMDGIPIAFKYDDFWSYSAKILESIQTVSPTLIPTSTFGTYDFSTGTGVIVANLSSVAGGATNDGGLQDPVDLSGGGDNVNGWTCEWGNTTQSCDVYGTNGGGDFVNSYSDPASAQGTTTTVGELLGLLQSMDPDWTVPIFYADYNQTGAGDSLFLTAKVVIYDTNGNKVAEWDLDALSNTQLDPAAPTYNFGDITFADSTTCTNIGAWNPITGEGCAGTTTSGETYTGSHNLGSGHADFMVFAQDMDLSMFNPDYLFTVTLNVGCIPGTTSGLIDPATGQQTTQGCNTNGYEEFGIIGGLGPTTTVPEPGSLSLLGVGLAAAAGAIRRRKLLA